MSVAVVRNRELDQARRPQRDAVNSGRLEKLESIAEGVGRVAAPEAWKEVVRLRRDAGSRQSRHQHVEVVHDYGGVSLARRPEDGFDPEM